MERDELTVFISDHCFICKESLLVIDEIRRDYPDVAVHFVNVDRNKPDIDIFAVPTYALNGKVVFLGNPSDEQIQHLLSNAQSISGNGRLAEARIQSSVPALGSNLIVAPKIDSSGYWPSIPAAKRSGDQDVRRGADCPAPQIARPDAASNEPDHAGAAAAFPTGGLSDSQQRRRRGRESRKEQSGCAAWRRYSTLWQKPQLSLNSTCTFP